MGDRRHDFTAAARGQIGEKSCDYLAGNIGKSIAVEEKERRAAMALPQKLYRFGEREDLGLFLDPFCSTRLLSLSIKAVLRTSSLARSSIEVDDKLPTPVFEKSGSGL